jgi:hypothetical protein
MSGGYIMPVSRFSLYFFTLALCSTFAFASNLSGKVALPNDAAMLEAASAQPPTPAERAGLLHRHVLLKMAQAASKTTLLTRPN